MRSSLVLSAVILSAAAWGSSPVTLPEVLSYLATSKNVIYIGSYLRHRHVATLMHQTIRQKQGTVTLVTSPYTYLDRASYFLGLYLAGANLYLGPVKEYYLILDERIVFRGRGLGAAGKIERLDGSEATKALAQARQVMAAARPFLASPEDIVYHYWR